MKNDKMFMFNLEIHKYCPVCKQEKDGGARDFEGTNFCPIGHTWFHCLVCDKTVVGEMPFVNHSGGSKPMVKGDPFKICQCNETAFLRTEI